METRPLRDIRWACARFGASRDSVYAWARAGWIPHCRIGRRVFFDESAIEVFIDSGGAPRKSANPERKKPAHEELSV